MTGTCRISFCLVSLNGGTLYVSGLVMAIQSSTGLVYLNILNDVAISSKVTRDMGPVSGRALP